MYIIGISGGSGTGKTTFLNKLAAGFDKSDVNILSQDDYYIAREKQLIDENGIRNFDLPTSLDLNKYQNDIISLRNGNDLELVDYTFNNKLASQSTKIIKPSKVLIVEGLFVFYKSEIRDLMDFKIMLHASDVHKLSRRILRDEKERNYPLDDVLYRYQHHVFPSYKKYIEPYMDEVDIVINNNDSFDNALSMLRAYLTTLIK